MAGRLRPAPCTPRSRFPRRHGHEVIEARANLGKVVLIP
jgi:hypothetical protein